MSSGAKDVYERHVAAVMRRDLDAVVAGYAADAVLVDTSRIGRGHEHIRAVFAEKLEAASRLEPELEVLHAEGVVFVSWRVGRSGAGDLVGGETFVVANGLIAVHTSYVTRAFGAGAATGQLEP